MTPGAKEGGESMGEGARHRWQVARTAAVVVVLVLPACVDGGEQRRQREQADQRRSEQRESAREDVPLGRERAGASQSLSDALMFELGQEDAAVNGWADLTEQEEKIETAKEAAREHAIESVPRIREFHEVYPDAVGYFEKYFAGWTDPQVKVTWYSRVWLHDRYELTLRVRVQLSEDGREIVSSGRARYFLIECRRVVDGPGGMPQPQAGRSGVFGERRWRELYEADGRIGDVFEGVVTDEPVDDFERYTRHKQRIHEADEDAAEEEEEEEEGDAEPEEEDEQ